MVLGIRWLVSAMDPVTLKTKLIPLLSVTEVWHLLLALFMDHDCK